MFFSRIVFTWNSLSQTIQSINRLLQFKTCRKQYLFDADGNHRPLDSQARGDVFYSLYGRLPSFIEEGAMNNGELNVLEYELSDYIWENCDKDYIREIVNKYITNENVDLNSDLDNYIYDIIDEIQDEVDNAYCIIDNVKQLMVEIINNAIDEEDISKLDYNNNGDKIKNLSL